MVRIVALIWTVLVVAVGEAQVVRNCYPKVTIKSAMLVDFLEKRLVPLAKKNGLNKTYGRIFVRFRNVNNNVSGRVNVYLSTYARDPIEEWLFKKPGYEIYGIELDGIPIVVQASDTCRYIEIHKNEKVCFYGIPFVTGTSESECTWSFWLDGDYIELRGVSNRGIHWLKTMSEREYTPWRVKPLKPTAKPMPAILENITFQAAVLIPPVRLLKPDITKQKVKR